jgi:ribonuclease P protein component
LLPAAERLRKTSVFQRAYSAKNSVNSGCVTLYVLIKRNHKKADSLDKLATTCRPDSKAGSSAMPANPASKSQTKIKWPHRSYPLVGFSISKKVLKSAVKRNRAKRRVREAYRILRQGAEADYIAQVNMDRFYSLVFVINPSVLTAKFEDVSAAMKDALVRASKKFSNKQ